MKAQKRRRIYGFAHIGNPIIFQCSLPFKISHDVSICRPTKTQLKRIRKHLHELNRFDDFRTPYESVWSRRQEKSRYLVHENGEEQEIQFFYAEEKPLAREDWKYAIVKYRADELVEGHYKPQDIVDLEMASQIGPQRLHLFSTYGAWSTRSGSDTELFDFLQAGVHRDHTEEWTLRDLQELKRTFEKVTSIRVNYPQLYHSFKLYWSLPKIKGYNELLCLGLFSVIESIITHNPKGDSDSISHQISAKVKLLGNRFPERVKHEFDQIDESKLWKKLYDFRSRLAHGGIVDFKGTFQVLKDSYLVQCYLEDFLNTLFRYALNEPQLCLDLKEC